MDLFDDLPLEPNALRTELAPGAVLLRGLTRGHEAALLQALQDVQAQAPRAPANPWGLYHVGADHPLLGRRRVNLTFRQAG